MKSTLTKEEISVLNEGGRAYAVYVITENKIEIAVGSLNTWPELSFYSKNVRLKNGKIKWTRTDSIDSSDCGHLRKDFW